MHPYIAFLRGMNLGQRRIKMDQLRELFEALPFSDVATFIASGNVIFSSHSSAPAKLEETIARHLERSLGYAVDTFVRTRREVATIATFAPFPAHDLTDPDHTVHVGFLSEALAPAQADALVACRTKVDEFCVVGREFYWLCRIRSSDSDVWQSPGMKRVGLPSCTQRNLTTVRKLAALYPPLGD